MRQLSLRTVLVVLHYHLSCGYVDTVVGTLLVVPHFEISSPVDGFFCGVFFFVSSLSIRSHKLHKDSSKQAQHAERHRDHKKRAKAACLFCLVISSLSFSLSFLSLSFSFSLSLSLCVCLWDSIGLPATHASIDANAKDTSFSPSSPSSARR